MTTQQPGRPSQPGRRRLEAPPEYDVPTRLPRLSSPRAVTAALAATVVAWVVGTAMAATSVVALPTPEWLARPGAAILLVVFSIGLTHRAGGHMRLWAVASAVLALAGVLGGTNVLISAAAVVTAMLATVWAVVVTRPARTILGALREYAVALAVGVSGTLGVAAWNAPVDYQRFSLVVVAASLGLALAFVWNLGAGLHGMGRQNVTIIVGVAVVFVLLLAYSSFVRSHGSQVLVDGMTNLVIWMRQTFGGVPRPMEVLVGFPALIVGVSVRSRRREGWWILVFAVLGTATLTTSLVSPGAYPSYIGLSTLYSVVLGGLIGIVLRHVVMNQRSARSARAILPESRVEPGRLAPLK